MLDWGFAMRHQSPSTFFCGVKVLLCSLMRYRADICLAPGTPCTLKAYVGDVEGLNQHSGGASTLDATGLLRVPLGIIP